MKSILVLLAMLLTLTACQKGQDKNKIEVKTPTQEETAAVDQAVEQTEEEVTPEEGTVMPEDDGIWLVNVDFAKKIAKEKDLKILFFFTGSDWCGWCQRLHKEVLDDENFQQELVKTFVPVKLDFPSKIKFPEAVNNSYRAEMKRYNVRGFPTLVLTDADGNAFATCGYQQGGPEPYLELLKELVDGKAELDAKAAETKNGDAAAGLELYKALEEYSEKFKDAPCVKEGLKPYYDICREKCPEVSRTLERAEKVKARLDELDEQYKLGEGYDPSEANPELVAQAAADYKAVIDSFKLEGEMKQEVLLKIAFAYAVIQEDEKVQEYVDQAVEAAPESELAMRIKADRDAQAIGDLMEETRQLIVDDKKDEALKAIDERLANEEDMNNKIMLTSMKAEIMVFFNDIEGAKENFQSCMDMCGNEEAKEQFKVCLEELDPFGVALTQSRLFIMREDADGAVAAIEKAIEEFKPEGAKLQEARIVQAQYCAQSGKQAEFTDYMKKAVEADPESEQGKAISEELERMERVQAQIQAQLKAQKATADDNAEEESEKTE